MRCGINALTRRAAVVGVLSLLAIAPSRAADQMPEVTKLVEQLRNTEIAFARTMADRDHEAFKSFLAEETVFYGGAGELRGRQAVADVWKKFYEAKEAPFSWRPEVVSVLDSGTLGLTSGPVFDPAGKQTGTFTSIWRRTTDGRWEIVFDRGCPYCPQG